MGCHDFWRDLFKVQTLDTRLISNSNDESKNKSKASQPRWKTPEFLFYALMFVIFVPLMIASAASAGSSSNSNYKLFADRLTPGWMGRPVDNSDAQYSGFRSQFPMLVLLALAHTQLRKLLGAETGPKRKYYDLVFGLLLICGLHGTGAVKIVLILVSNFALGQISQSRSVSWVFAVGILFANELLHGYPIYQPWEFGGLLPQWQVFFKCTMMRMLSFNLDYIESLDQALIAAYREKFNEKDQLQKEPSELARICLPRPENEYSLVDYLGYCLYAPLYLAGPILTFNDFRSQAQASLSSISSSRTIAYAVRFFLCMMCMEVILHFIPVVAISETRAWVGLTPSQVSMVGFFNLVVIWLKLLLPWRFFRLWSLVDKIDPPENMIRCVANNYSALSFWRSWHRSFHKWVVRYLYIPLGGSKAQLRNSLIVFAFVAVWHDIQLRLFVWGGLIVLFVAPEIAARALVPSKKYGSKSWYRIVAAIGAVGNIWMMLIANLVGFAVGVDGIRNLLYEMMHTARGLLFTILCSALLFVGAQVMFEYREMELRHGIDIKC
nr:Gup1 [Starmerella bombicola]